MSDTPDPLPILEIRDLTVSFPSANDTRLRAADGVNLTIYPRQTLAVVGESGSGKSVSAMSVLQLIPTPPGSYDGGQILWRAGGGSGGTGPSSRGYSGPASGVGVGEDLLSYSDRQMREVRGNQIAMIFQEPMTSLNPVYTIGSQIVEAVLLHQTSSRTEARNIAEGALRDVGIADPASRLKEYPHQLSGGMRQRVMIAMALACQPRLLLADEPTTALDVTIQAQILELLRKLQDEKDMSMMLITHDLGVVAENADVVAVMFAGRIVEFADVHELFGSPMHPYTRGLLRSMPVLGRNVDRLDTVMDGATIPEDFPAGYTVQPHNPAESAAPAPAPGRRYGGDGAKLHEVRPDHWVLCAADEGTAGQATRPALNYRRPSSVASSVASG
jgi:ABC-type dipeptide/oligopeptide/nickel transport system ATPase component